MKLSNLTSWVIVIIIIIIIIVIPPPPIPPDCWVCGPFFKANALELVLLAFAAYKGIEAWNNRRAGGG